MSKKNKIKIIYLKRLCLVIVDCINKVRVKLNVYYLFLISCLVYYNTFFLKIQYFYFVIFTFIKFCKQKVKFFIINHLLYL